MKTALIVSYLGTHYCGWQVQPNAPSVQKTLQNVLEDVAGRPVSVTGCSRTDSGVHARGFWCHLDSLFPVPADKIPFALNRLLPPDIAVLRALDVPDEFHARYSATGKQYSYTVCNSRIRDVFSATTALWWPRAIDATRADEICRQFVGTHDFSAFMAAGSKIREPVRTVSAFTVERQQECVRFTVTADGFLYNMVRIMTGTVLGILAGNVKHSVPEIIASRDRDFAGRTLPPMGLCLERVFYSLQGGE